MAFPVIAAPTDKPSDYSCGVRGSVEQSSQGTEVLLRVDPPTEWDRSFKKNGLVPLGFLTCEPDEIQRKFGKQKFETATLVRLCQAINVVKGDFLSGLLRAEEPFCVGRVNIDSRSRSGQ